MAIALHTNKAKDLTSFNITGSVGFIELLIEVDAFYDLRPTAHVLLNFLEVNNIRFKAKHVKRFAEYYPRYEPNREKGKVALVVKENEHLRLAKRFKVQSDLKGMLDPIMVFQNLDDAYQWFDEP
jgi:hypothetical protein